MSNFVIQYRSYKQYIHRIKYEKLINPNYILSYYEILEIRKARQDDILKRGKDHYVYDLDGHVTRLENACIWHYNGLYGEPISSKKCLIC